MATITIRLRDERHERLKKLAEQRGLSLNTLIEEWSTVALTYFDAETLKPAFAFWLRKVIEESVEVGR